MKTPQEWWAEVKANPELLMDWLRKQYHGERTAAVRIRDFLVRFATDKTPVRWVSVVRTIARQEEDHAAWVGELLRSRGEEPAVIEGKEERYWEATLPGIDSWASGCAVAAEAEKMRLERIKVIVDDETAPWDIREVFLKILPQEEFHERAFREYTTPEALEAHKDNHEAGLAALGLVL